METRTVANFSIKFLTNYLVRLGYVDETVNLNATVANIKTKTLIFECFGFKATVPFYKIAELFVSKISGHDQDFITIGVPFITENQCYVLYDIAPDYEAAIKTESYLMWQPRSNLDISDLLVSLTMTHIRSQRSAISNALNAAKRIELSSADYNKWSHEAFINELLRESK